MKNLIIASRKSPLALWQSNFVKTELEKKYPNLNVEIKTFTTKGDKILDVALSKIGGKELFTKELEDALIKGEAHIAVHSLKDVPVVFSHNLDLIAITKRQNEEDAFLSNTYTDLKALKQGAIVGTTSLRRKMQLLNFRQDLQIKDLRGNIHTRLSKLQNGEFDAIILAAVGVRRMGLEKEVKYFTPIDKKIILPAMGQAALGIEAINTQEMRDLLSFLDDAPTRIATTAERDFVKALNGSCQVPIGVNACFHGQTLEITAKIGMPNGKEFLQKTIQKTQNYEQIGKDLADEMIKMGAKDLLKKALEMDS